MRPGRRTLSGWSCFGLTGPKICQIHCLILSLASGHCARQNHERFQNLYLIIVILPVSEAVCRCETRTADFGQRTHGSTLQFLKSGSSTVVPLREGRGGGIALEVLHLRNCMWSPTSPQRIHNWPTTWGTTLHDPHGFGNPDISVRSTGTPCT